MALIITVNGVTKGLMNLSISASQNERDRMTCVLLSLDGTDIPSIDYELIATEDGTRIFGGSIKTPTRCAHGDAPPPVVATKISALDFNELADRQTVTITVPAGSLKAAATALLPYLTGVTIDAGWTDPGPDMPELVWTDTYVQAALDELSTRSGWLRNIDYSKVLKFFEAGTVSAPWNIADTDYPPKTIGDMTVTPTRIDYANRIIVKFMGVARVANVLLLATSNFANGETVTIGGQVYTFQTVLTDVSGNVLIGANTEASLGNLNAAINHAGGGNYAASTPVHASVTSYMLFPDRMLARAITAGAAGNSIAVTDTAANADWVGEGNVPKSTLTGGGDAALTGRAQVDDLVEQALPGVGIYTSIVEAENVYTYESAIALGNAIVAFSVITFRTIEYETDVKGLFPGMMQTIQRTSRGLNDTCLITSVNRRQLEGSLLRCSVSLVVGDTFKADRWRNQYKKWAGGGGSAALSFSGTVVSGGSSGGGRSVYFLGGTPEVWVQSPTPTWVAASGGVDGQGGIEYLIDTTVRGSTIGTVRVRLRAASGNVTARLWNVTTSAQVGISAAVTSTTFVLKTFSVSLTAGANVYRLELLPSAANTDVNGVGYFE